MARLAGFGVRGYRDFRERSYFGPWGKINVVGGANNVGKSALLHAMARYLAPRGDGTLGAASSRSLDALDIPDREDAGVLEIGYAADFGEDLVHGFMGAAVGFPAADGVRPHRLEQFLRQSVFGPSVDDLAGGLRWFWIDDSTAALAREVGEIIDSFPDSQYVLSGVTSSGYSGTVTWDGVLRQVVARLEAPKGVIYVPASRQIRATAHRNAGLPGADGAGLPGMLLALIAPKADEYYRARSRLARVNEFLAAVLGRPSAELLVPHDADTVHVALEGRVRPLSHLGAGLEQAVLLATICTEYEDHLVLIEEPDLFMHPTLQRQFLRHLRDDSSGNTYVVTTHSAALLDTDWANVFRVDWTPERGTRVSLVSGPADRAQLATSLGFRASDLVQANAVIWVEGPSDRIYIKRWLELADELDGNEPTDRLLEGVHFSFVMYGGRLGQHLTASEIVRGADCVDASRGASSDAEVDRLVEIYRINRHAVFVLDSDRASDADDLAPYKTRLAQEFAESDEGLLWVTAGRTIENYVDPGVHGKAYGDVHTRTPLKYDGELLSDPFDGGVVRPDKVRVAQISVALTDEIPDRGDLRAQVSEVREYLRRVNGLASHGPA